MSVLIFLIVYYVLLSLSLYKVFEKAGEAGWKGLVPGLNFITWCKLIGRPGWWAALLLLPIVNIFILAGMNVDLVRSFGKYTFFDSALAVIYAPISFFLLGFKADEQYVGPILDREKAYQDQLLQAQEKGNTREFNKLMAANPYRKSIGREWAEAIIFAVFAAAFIRMFLIEAYVIPTSSMEGSLLVGDFLFVSKAHYGIRTPMTVVQFPLIHNTVPVLGSESYLKSPKLPYYRLPAIENIDRNDPVVFNYPAGDSVMIGPDRNYSVEDLRRYNQLDKPPFRGKKPRVRPIDKKDHYIKRCVGIPGDKIEIRARQLYVNDQPAQNPSKLQYSYRVNLNGSSINEKKLDEWGVSLAEIHAQRNKNVRTYSLNEAQLAKVKALNDQIEVTPAPLQSFPGYLFPHDPRNFPGWTNDDYGPITIPAAGASVTITPNNIELYRRIITAYEGHELSIKNGRIFIDGQQTTSYTFAQDYYWMMGDNRHNSEDSRVWGFVPA
ncbi:MAG: signal peptidase I, partial [Bacteroidota bacterium]